MTRTKPDVAAAGIVTISCVIDAEVTVAAVSLIVTVFALGVVLKPVPVIVIELPTGACNGHTFEIVRSVSVVVRCKTMLPTASY